MGDINWPEITEKLVYEKGDEGKAQRKVLLNKQRRNQLLA